MAVKAAMVAAAVARRWRFPQPTARARNGGGVVVVAAMAAATAAAVTDRCWRLGLP